MSVLGQLVGGAGEAGITYEDAVKQLGYTADSLLDEIIGALADKDGATVFRVIDDVVRAGHDPRRFTTDLLERLRDLIVLKAAPDAATHGLIHQPEDRLQVLADQAEAMGIAELSRAADLVSDGLSALRGATAPRLHLELLAARLLVNSEADASSLAARLDGLERKIAQGDFTVTAVGSSTSAPAAPAAPVRATPPPRLSDVAPATASAAPATPAAPIVEPVAAPVVEAAVEEVVEPVVETAAPEVAASAAESAPAAPAPADEVDLAAIQALWPAAVELIKSLPTGGRLAWMSAQSGWPMAATPTELTIAFDNMGPFNMAKSRGFDAVFAQAANQVMGRTFRVVLTHDASLVIPSDDAPAAPMTPQPVAAAQHTEVIAEADEPAEPAIEPRRIIEEVAAEAAQPVVAPEDDIPSDDDPVSTTASGAALLAEMLGAHVIDEYEEKTK
jgi:DNA polymerase-3 subunit gamma/tau